MQIHVSAHRTRQVHTQQDKTGIFYDVDSNSMFQCWDFFYIGINFINCNIVNTG